MVRGLALSLVGAALGIAAWVGIASLPIPLYLIGLSAALLGGLTGAGMRLGGARSPKARAAAAGIAALAVAPARYLLFVACTRSYRWGGGPWVKPELGSADCARFFLTRHLFPAQIWPLGISLVLFAVAAYFAWRTA